VAGAGLGVCDPAEVATETWRSLRIVCSAPESPPQAELGRGRPPRFGDPSGSLDFQLDS